MVTLDCAFVPLGWNSSADGKTRRNTNAARQSNEIGVEIGAVTGAHITGVLGVAATPAGPGLVVAHAAHHMIVQRFRAIEIVSFSRRRFLSERPEGFVNRYQFLRTQITCGFCILRRIRRFFLAHDTVSHLDRFAAIFRPELENTNVIAILAVMSLFPSHWNIQLFDGHGLKGVGLCQRYPDVSLACDVWKFNSINKLKL